MNYVKGAFAGQIVQKIGKVMEEIRKEADQNLSEKTGVCNAVEGEQQVRNPERSIQGELMALTEQGPTSDIDKTSPSHCPMARKSHTIPTHPHSTATHLFKPP